MMNSRILSAAVLASIVAGAARSRGAHAPDSLAGIEASVMTPQAIVQESKLMEALRALPTKRAANSDEENVKGLLATESLIVDRLRAMGLTPKLEGFRWKPTAEPNAKDEVGEAREWHNIMVEFPGTGSVVDTGTPGNDPSQGVATREVVLVGAHFDAVPLAPGADDNGTSVAALLEMARAYQAMHGAGWTHARTLRLVFFNLEEPGLVGSTHHAAQWKLANNKALAAGKEQDQPARNPTVERISLMLSLECLGFFSDAANSQRSPFKPIPNVFEPPTVGDNIVLVTIAKHRATCKELGDAMLRAGPGLKVFRADFSPLPLPDLMRSDHAPFMLAGIPSIMVTDTANFRNPNYHRPTDTVETIDAARFTLVARGVAGAVWELAQPKAPEKHDKQRP